MNIDEIDAALGAAPRLGRPPEDPWPPIEARMIERVRLRRPGLLSVVAVVLFLAGAAVGYGAARQRARLFPGHSTSSGVAALPPPPRSRRQARHTWLQWVPSSVLNWRPRSGIRRRSARAMRARSRSCKPWPKPSKGCPSAGSAAEPLAVEATRLRACGRCSGRAIPRRGRCTMRARCRRRAPAVAVGLRSGARHCGGAER